MEQIILFWKKNIFIIVFAILALGIVIFSFVYFPKAQMLNAGDFGVVSFISSLPQNKDKDAMIAKIKKAGFGWVREEYTYTLPMNYVPFDVAYKRLLGADLKILGLLTYPGPDKSHDIWKAYVAETVSRYPEVAAWEIMNEADNYLSAADYTVYLQEASEIIRAKSNARIITTGITSRVGDNQFWDGVAAAGGWPAFDAIALHIYHFGDPYKDTNDNGTFPQEIQKATESVKKNGGGKTVWVTEFGFDTNDFSEADQAKWLVECLSIMKAIPEVERGFLFRLYEHDNGLGLLNAKFEEKPAFSAVQNWLAQGAPATPESLIAVKETFEVALPQSKIDITQSQVRVDGTNISPDGQEQFRVVVGLKNVEGKVITDQKPILAVSGKQTVPTDFTLVGDEWFAYVASTEAGEKTGRVEVANTDVGQVKMVFGITDTKAASEVVPEATPTTTTPTATISPSITQPVVTTYPIVEETSARSKTGLLWFLIIESIILIAIAFIGLKLWQRSRSQ